MSKTITIRQEQKGCYSAIRVDVADFADFVQRMSSLPIDAIFPSAWVKAGLLVMGDHGVHVLTPRGEDLLASAHLIPDDPAPEQPSAPPCEACNGTGERVLFVNMQVCDVCHGSKVKRAPQPGRAYLNQQESPAAQFLRHMTTAVIGHSSAGIHPQYGPQPYTRRVLFPLTDDEKAALRRYAKTTPFDDAQVRYSMALSVESDGTRVKTEHLPDGRTLRLRENAAGWMVESVTPAASPWVLIDSEDVARSFVGKRVEIDAPCIGQHAEHTHHRLTAVVEYVSENGRLWITPATGFPVGIDWTGRGNVRLRVVGGSDV